MKNLYKLKSTLVLFLLLMAGGVVMGAAPTATTNAASSVGASTATLNSTVNPNGEVTTVYFEYGETTAYGITIYVPGTFSGSSAVYPSIEVLGLTHQTTYHFRVVAVNASGTTTGSDLSFTTTTGVTTNNVYNIASTSATVRYTATGTFNERGYWLGTGTDEPGQSATGRTANPDSLTYAGICQTIISGLTSGTTYKVCGYSKVSGTPDVYTNGEILYFVPGSTFPVTYNCLLTEGQLNSSSEYQFEVYIYRTGTNPLYLNNYQLGFEFDADVSLIRDLYITGEFVPNSIDPNITSLTPGGLTVAYQAPGVGHAVGHMDVRINGPVPSSTGYLIPVTPGYRIGQFKVKNWTDASHTTPKDFGRVTPNFGWDNDFIARTYIYAIYPGSGGSSITGTRVIITDMTQHTNTTSNLAFNSLTWKGPTSASWATAGNWSGNPSSLTGPPSSTTMAYIPTSGVTNNPTISGATTYECDTLNIASGRVLTIASDGGLKVNGALINNAGTTGLVVQSTSGGTGSLLHNTDNVNATIQRYISGNGYHTVSVPLTSAANPTSNLFFGSYLYYFAENQTSPVDNGWVNMGTSTTAPLDVNRGYMIYYPGANTAYNFTGPMNNGTITPTATYTSGSPDVNRGFNLVPNPYPSAIDWSAVSGWTKTNVYDATWIWNPVAGNYSAFGSQTGGVVNGTRYIPQGQAFFIQASNTPTFSFNNSVRVHTILDVLNNTA